MFCKVIKGNPKVEVGLEKNNSVELTHGICEKCKEIEMAKADAFFANEKKMARLLNPQQTPAEGREDKTVGYSIPQLILSLVMLVMLGLAVVFAFRISEKSLSRENVIAAQVIKEAKDAGFRLGIPVPFANENKYCDYLLERLPLIRSGEVQSVYRNQAEGGISFILTNVGENSVKMRVNSEEYNLFHSHTGLELASPMPSLTDLFTGLDYKEQMVYIPNVGLVKIENRGQGTLNPFARILKSSDELATVFLKEKEITIKSNKELYLYLHSALMNKLIDEIIVRNIPNWEQDFSLGGPRSYYNPVFWPYFVRLLNCTPYKYSNGSFGAMTDEEVFARTKGISKEGPELFRELHRRAREIMEKTFNNNVRYGDERDFKTQEPNDKKANDIIIGPNDVFPAPIDEYDGLGDKAPKKKEGKVGAGMFMPLLVLPSSIRNLLRRLFGALVGMRGEAKVNGDTVVFDLDGTLVNPETKYSLINRKNIRKTIKNLRKRGFRVGIVTDRAYIDPDSSFNGYTGKFSQSKESIELAEAFRGQVPTQVFDDIKSSLEELGLQISDFDFVAKGALVGLSWYKITLVNKDNKAYLSSVSFEDKEFLELIGAEGLGIVEQEARASSKPAALALVNKLLKEQGMPGFEGRAVLMVGDNKNRDDLSKYIIPGLFSKIKFLHVVSYALNQRGISQAALENELRGAETVGAVAVAKVQQGIGTQINPRAPNRIGSLITIIGAITFLGAASAFGAEVGAVAPAVFLGIAVSTWQVIFLVALVLAAAGFLGWVIYRAFKTRPIKCVAQKYNEINDRIEKGYDKANWDSKVLDDYDHIEKNGRDVAKILNRILSLKGLDSQDARQELGVDEVVTQEDLSKLEQLINKRLTGESQRKALEELAFIRSLLQEKAKIIKDNESKIAEMDAAINASSEADRIFVYTVDNYLREIDRVPYALSLQEKIDILRHILRKSIYPVILSELSEGNPEGYKALEASLKQAKSFEERAEILAQSELIRNAVAGILQECLPKENLKDILLITVLGDKKEFASGEGAKLAEELSESIYKIITADLNVNFNPKYKVEGLGISNDLFSKVAKELPQPAGWVKRWSPLMIAGAALAAVAALPLLPWGAIIHGDSHPADNQTPGTVLNPANMLGTNTQLYAATTNLITNLPAAVTNTPTTTTNVPAVDMQPVKARRVKELLQEAASVENDFGKIGYYWSVLELDPNNAEAKQELIKIKWAQINEAKMLYSNHGPEVSTKWGLIQIYAADILKYDPQNREASVLLSESAVKLAVTNEVKVAPVVTNVTQANAIPAAKTEIVTSKQTNTLAVTKNAKTNILALTEINREFPYLQINGLQDFVPEQADRFSQQLLEALRFANKHYPLLLREIKTIVFTDKIGEKDSCAFFDTRKIELAKSGVEESYDSLSYGGIPKLQAAPSEAKSRLGASFLHEVSHFAHYDVERQRPVILQYYLELMQNRYYPMLPEFYRYPFYECLTEDIYSYFFTGKPLEQFMAIPRDTIAAEKLDHSAGILDIRDSLAQRTWILEQLRKRWSEAGEPLLGKGNFDSAAPSSFATPVMVDSYRDEVSAQVDQLFLNAQKDISGGNFKVAKAKIKEVLDLLADVEMNRAFISYSSAAYVVNRVDDGIAVLGQLQEKGILDNQGQTLLAQLRKARIINGITNNDLTKFSREEQGAIEYLRQEALKELPLDKSAAYGLMSRFLKDPPRLDCSKLATRLLDQAQSVSRTTDNAPTATNAASTNVPAAPKTEVPAKPSASTAAKFAASLALRGYLGLGSILSPYLNENVFTSRLNPPVFSQDRAHVTVDVSGPRAPPVQTEKKAVVPVPEAKNSEALLANYHAATEKLILTLNKALENGKVSPEENIAINAALSKHIAARKVLDASDAIAAGAAVDKPEKQGTVTPIQPDISKEKDKGANPARAPPITIGRISLEQIRGVTVDERFASEDISLLKQLGANTIRTYLPLTDKDLLNDLENNGIRVIMGIPYDTGAYEAVGLPVGPNIKDGSYMEYIKEHKDSSAILMWEFGNEYNYHPDWFTGGIDIWYADLEKAAQTAHNLDPSRRVSTAHGDLPSAEIVRIVPHVDIWGINAYRFDNISSLFSDLTKVTKELGYALPIYISESGADSYNNNAKREDEKAQAYADMKIWQQINTQTNSCFGITFMSLKDNPDKNQVSNNTGVYPDSYANENSWGFFKKDSTPKEVAGL
ncbi:MAG: HAD hydrolase family protein, partial [Candidatus Omnitrophica bacterium]|nr:HAD hydrolase family protein [Candidatus Omnitrophota bacterium]